MRGNKPKIRRNVAALSPDLYGWIVLRHFYRNKEGFAVGIRSNPVNLGDSYRDE